MTIEKVICESSVKIIGTKMCSVIESVKAPFAICKWSENLLFSDVVEVTSGEVKVYPLYIVNNTLMVFV